MKASIIISTYNSPDWLRKVLWGYSVQTEKDFEIVIADDGSTSETSDLLDQMRSETQLNIIHIWQEDDGFQKSQILNKALEYCNSEYIIMSDGDCIPRKDFLKIHLQQKSKGYFLSGGYFKLPLSISNLITESDIKNQNCFDLKWLKKNGLKLSLKNIKLRSSGLIEKILNDFTTTNASWNGHNASGWKEDILAVNGFDERMQYGGQDRELGERLFNYGINSKQIRYSAICMHLDHPRGYKTQNSLNKNFEIRKSTIKNNKKWTDFGIKKNMKIK